MPYEGGCLCRANRYEILRKHLNAMHCYCEMCREAHGTAMSAHLIIRPEKFRWTAGGDLMRRHGGANEHVLIRIGGTWCAEGITF